MLDKCGQFLGKVWTISVISVDNFRVFCGISFLFADYLGECKVQIFFLVNIILFILGLKITHIMLFWFKAQVQILYLVAFHNCNCMTWVSNRIDFDAWLLFISMINNFMKYSNSIDFHFACGQGNGYY
jgi:hypothetical protein